MRLPTFGLLALSGFFGSVALAASLVPLRKLLGALPELPVSTALATSLLASLSIAAAWGCWRRGFWTLSAVRAWCTVTVAMYIWLFLGTGVGVPALLQIAALPFGSALIGLVFLLDRGTKYALRRATALDALCETSRSP